MHPDDSYDPDSLHGSEPVIKGADLISQLPETHSFRRPEVCDDQMDPSAGVWQLLWSIPE